MSTLNDFYQKVIENLGLYVDEDGFILSRKVDGIPITNDGKPMVLPSKEHINSVYTTDENGKPIVSKSLFNPINEDVIKGDSPSLKKTKIFAERRLGHVFYHIGRLLLILAENKNLQRNVKLELNKFLGLISEASGVGIKLLVDEKSLSNWEKIYKLSLEKPVGLFTIYLKKRAKYDGETYNRLAVFGSSVYDELASIEKEGSVYDVKLRPKEVTIFRILFEFILQDLEDRTISVGSNDNESPGFISLMSLYVKLLTRMNKLLDQLKSIDKEVYDSCYIPNLVTIQELESLDVYSSELATIPNEIDLNRQAISKQQQNLLAVPANVLNVNTAPISNQVAFPNQPVPIQQPPMDDDPVRRALGGISQPQVPTNQFVGLNTITPPMMTPPVSPYAGQPIAPTIGAPYQPQPFVGLNNPNLGANRFNVSNPGAYYPQQPSTIFPWGR